MENGKEVHVVPNITGGEWSSKIEDAECASKYFDTNAMAMNYAKNQTKNIGAGLISNRKNDAIQNRNNY